MFKGNLLKSIKLVGLSKRQSSELILEAIIHNVLKLSVNNTLYDQSSEAIPELFYTIHPLHYDKKNKP